MNRLTQWDENKELIVREEEWLLNANGLITKDEMYKIMRHLAERLSTYEDAEEQGLLLKLPCKVGDTIYCFGCGGEIIEGVCKAIQIDETCKMVFIEGKDFCFWKMFEKFGKTVFLTKEEAEQALKQMKEV